ncbi:transcriptional regulator [Rhodobacterales bacterium HKCCE3408]|nr:transcriptional regulator [Rhodobacterales bacterium HKCCE3408]
MDGNGQDFVGANITRDRDKFLRELLRELAGVLEDAVGLEQAEGFIAMVGRRIARLMNDEYVASTGQDRLDRTQVANALTDLKRRIQGGFSVESIDEDRIILVNDRCPFGEYVRDRTSLCMMTMHVFGSIAAANLGYARIELPETIAKGDGRCRVIISFSEGDEGREFYR